MSLRRAPGSSLQTLLANLQRERLATRLHIAPLSETEINEEIAFVKLRYKQPGTPSSVEFSQAVNRDRVSESIVESSTDLRFAASVAGFGQILKGGTFTSDWSYTDALLLARNSRGDDPHGYRSEFIHLIELAQSLSSSP